MDHFNDLKGRIMGYNLSLRELPLYEIITVT